MVKTVEIVKLIPTEGWAKYSEKFRRFKYKGGEIKEFNYMEFVTAKLFPVEVEKPLESFLRAYVIAKLIKGWRPLTVTGTGENDIEPVTPEHSKGFLWYKEVNFQRMNFLTWLSLGKRIANLHRVRRLHYESKNYPRSIIWWVPGEVKKVEMVNGTHIFNPLIHKFPIINVEGLSEKEINELREENLREVLEAYRGSNEAILKGYYEVDLNIEPT